MRPSKSKIHKFNRIDDHHSKSQKSMALRGKVRQLKISKQLSGAHEANESDKLETEVAFLHKIDYYSFIGYLLGYCLFNFVYWINMLSEN